VSNFLSSKRNPRKAEGRAARRLGGPLNYFEASLFDLPDEDGMTALPLGSSLDSPAKNGKNAAGDDAGGDEVAGPREERQGDCSLG
jgi:hypothetical protein